jgi:phage terminase large subunit
MTALRIPTSPVFRPLLQPARYLGAWGGRGSGKSHFFGELMVEERLRVPGTLAVCIREVQKSLMQSSKRMIESKIQSLGVGSRFKILHGRIITPGDGLIIFQGMQEATAESIKSLEGFRIAWAEKAQTLTHRSLSLLRPTIRVKGSQLWANWNPRRKGDAIDDFLRAKKPDNAAWSKLIGGTIRGFLMFLMSSGGLILKFIPSAMPTARRATNAKDFEAPILPST